jgi:catechol 2,3-dioxygenase-like lactoylglutathione lyase family enzyme
MTSEDCALIQTSLFRMAAPQLPALNLEQSVQFYKQSLGFRVIAEYPGFVILLRDRVEIHLWSCNEPVVAENSSCYIRLRDIESFYGVMQEQGVDIREVLETRPWGMKQFTVADPSGNFIRFGEALGEEVPWLPSDA